ncbi:MAG TPA: DinB family protein [Planctomycetota bacterium]|nr:DinB family protein [Planctomycetota bacterium]
MDLTTAIRAEYQRHRRLVELAIAQVQDADLSRRPGPGGNSIAITMVHLAGNLRSRFTDFLTSDGEKPWRHRDREFDEPGLGRAELLEAWTDAWQVLGAALATVDDAGPGVFERSVTIRKQPLTVLEALMRSMAHVAYHTGQIVQLARTFAGDAWQSLSIPRGGSDDYARNPARERGPG